MARDRLYDGLADLSRFGPVRLEPLLELRDLARALDLDVQLDVLRETRPREVAGAHQGLSAHDLELCVGDVGLGVEFVLVVDTAFDLPRAERVEDRRDPAQEGVRLLVLLDALVEPVERLRPHRLENGPPSPMGRLSAHQEPDLVEPLPLAVEGEQGVDLEVSGRDVERLGDAAPLLQVPEPGPAGDTVVDDEELAALGVNAHVAAVRTSSVARAGSSLPPALPLLPVGHSLSGWTMIRPVGHPPPGVLPPYALAARPRRAPPLTSRAP